MADADLQWAADVDLTITLASLASDANLLAGRESTAVVSSAQSLVEDFLLSGRTTTGTSPTAGTIEIRAYAQIDDTPTYPDVLDGTDSNETISDDNAKNVSTVLVAAIPTDTTSDQSYDWGPVSVVGLFGELPERFGVFEAHDTGVALNATGSNHFVRATPVYRNIA